MRALLANRCERTHDRRRGSETGHGCKLESIMNTQSSTDPMQLKSKRFKRLAKNLVCLGMIAVRLSHAPGTHAQDTLITDNRGNPVPLGLLNRISLQMDEIPFHEAIEEVTAQTGVPINYSERLIPADQKVTLHIEDVTAVEALQKILSQAQITFIVSKGGQVVLVKTESKQDRVQRHTISGHLRDAGSGEALIGTNIYVEELRAGCTTNVYGFYSLTLPAGPYTVRYQYIGFEPKVLAVSLDQDLTRDVELISVAIPGQKVTVIAETRDRNVTSTEMGTIHFKPAEVDRVPLLLGEQDILRTIHLLPGVTQAREADCGFYVRGGNSDQNLILLDEAPVHNAYHLMGTFSVFNADAVKNVNLIKGSAPAKYGGKCSSVLDIQMHEGNLKSFQVNGGIGLIFSRLTIQGPFVRDKASFMFSGRRTYADMFTRMSSDETLRNSRLYFYDLNMKTNAILGPKDRLYASGYFGRDALKVAARVDEEGDDVIVKWGNKTGTLRWNHIFNHRLFFNTSLVYNDFRYEMGVLSYDTEVRVSSSLAALTWKGDFEYFLNPRNTINLGLHYTHHNFKPAHFNISEDTFLELQFGEKKAKELTTYLSHEWKPLPRIKTDVGFRVTLFSMTGAADEFDFQHMERVPDEFYDLALHQDEKIRYRNLEPRFTTTIRVGASSSFKLGYARNYQNVHLLSNSTSGTPLNVWHPSSRMLRPQRADQVSGGYFWNFGGDAYEASFELFYKDLRNQSDYKDGADIFLSSFFESELAFGKGWAYGAEIFIKKRTGRLTGWIGYTLSRSKRKFTEINTGNPFPAVSDRPHDLAIVGLYQLSRRWTLSVNWIYNTGTPVTVPYGKYRIDGKIVHAHTPRNAYRLPAYHRLDIGLSFTIGRASALNLSLYNAYGRRNAYAIIFQEHPYDPHAVEAVRLALFSFMPSLSFNFTL